MRSALAWRLFVDCSCFSSLDYALQVSKRYKKQKPVIKISFQEIDLCSRTHVSGQGSLNASKRALHAHLYTVVLIMAQRLLGYSHRQWHQIFLSGNTARNATPHEHHKKSWHIKPYAWKLFFFCEVIYHLRTAAS